jgi:hypothetical protein
MSEIVISGAVNHTIDGEETKAGDTIMLDGKKYRIVDVRNGQISVVPDKVSPDKRNRHQRRADKKKSRLK